MAPGPIDVAGSRVRSIGKEVPSRVHSSPLVEIQGHKATSHRAFLSCASCLDD